MSPEMAPPVTPPSPDVPHGLSTVPKSLRGISLEDKKRYLDIVDEHFHLLFDRYVTDEYIVGHRFVKGSYYVAFYKSVREDVSAEVLNEYLRHKGIEFGSTKRVIPWTTSKIVPSAKASYGTYDALHHGDHQGEMINGVRLPTHPPFQTEKDKGANDNTLNPDAQ